MMFTLILSVLDTGLKLWLSKERTKYVDKLMRLQKEYYEESNKPAEERSDAVLDNLFFELRILASAFAAEARVSDAPPKP
jgi:hypothetical protein